MERPNTRGIQSQNRSNRIQSRGASQSNQNKQM